MRTFGPVEGVLGDSHVGDEPPLLRGQQVHGPGPVASKGLGGLPGQLVPVASGQPDGVELLNVERFGLRPAVCTGRAGAKRALLRPVVCTGNALEDCSVRPVGMGAPHLSALDEGADLRHERHAPIAAQMGQGLRRE